MSELLKDNVEEKIKNKENQEKEKIEKATERADKEEEKQESFEKDEFKEIEVPEDKYVKLKKVIFITTFSFLIVFILFIMSVILALLNNNNPKILSNIFIDGIEVENLTREEAEQKLEVIINDKITKPIKLKCGDIEKEINLQDLSVSYNIGENVRKGI